METSQLMDIPNDQLITKHWLVDHLPFEILWIAEDGKIEYANLKACKTSGYERKLPDGHTIFDLNPRLTSEQWESHWRLVKKEKVNNFKTYHRRKDGNLYEVEVSALFFSNKGKNLIAAILSDITQSSFYRNVLVQAEKMVQAGGWKLNLQDQSLIVTAQSFEIFELEDKEEFRPVNIVRYFDTPDVFREMITLAIREGKSFDETLGITTHNGKHKWVRCTAEVIRIQGKVQKVIGVYQDVTEDYLKSEALQLFKDIIDYSDDIVFIWEANGDLFHFSNSAISQLQFSRDDLEQVTIFDLDPVIDQEWWKSHFEDIRQRKHFRMEWIATRRDGTRFPVDISVNGITHQGRMLNCAVLRDITARKNRELELQNALQEIEELKIRLESENEYLQEEVIRNINFDNIICESESYAKVLKLVEQVAPTDSTVLITGESGTGKELLATAIHQHSNRKDRPLIKVNCATLPKELIESELFGHKKGAFTGAVADKVGKFAVADGGTLFLDEIGELPIDLQPKLLRVLQEGEFDMLGGTKTQKIDVRIITATNRDLEEMVKDGTFREDLFYRINVFPIYNIPLRERREDIPLLASFFMEKYASKAGKRFTRISKKVIEQFMQYPFPGNIRELENLIERAVIIENGPVLTPGPWMPVRTAETSKATLKSMDEMQRDYILQVLKETEGRVSGPKGAAAILDMNAKTLFARMAKLGIKKNLVHS